MRIPFITSAHNSLSQRLQVELVVTYRTAAMPRTNEVPLYFAGMPRAKPGPRPPSLHRPTGP